MAQIEITIEEVDGHTADILTVLGAVETAHPNSPEVAALHTQLASTLDALLEKFPEEDRPQRRSGGGKGGEGGEP